VKVIILGAGQGKRLLPLTAEVPKALLDIGGQPLIERQIAAFAAAGSRDFVVITGYGATTMDETLAAIANRLNVTVRTVYNPFYAVADNLASCWMARHEMAEPFIQVNGDNVFRADLAKLLVAPPRTAVAAAINRKGAYDADDMKVMLDGAHLTEVGKGLPLEAVDAEAIGFYVFDETGAGHYVRELDNDMRDPQALRQWFPSAIGRLAKRIEVGVIDCTGREWCEVDVPTDLTHARHLVASW
jgi:L-glutamine-phosphate cytidylyltransferase